MVFNPSGKLLKRAEHSIVVITGYFKVNLEVTKPLRIFSPFPLEKGHMVAGIPNPAGSTLYIGYIPIYTRVSG
jgi:hypothetical protein